MENEQQTVPASVDPELLSQLIDHHNPVKVITPGMPELLRQAAAQGAVLLENNGVLPLPKDCRVSVFGRIQVDYFYTGYGSGGDVNLPYHVSLLDGLRSCDRLCVNEELAQIYENWVREHPASTGVWGDWPRSHPEMPVSEALVCKAREQSDAAVLVLGRASGEDRENILAQGSFYLTEEEEQLLSIVTARFPQTVLVLNIGNILDFSFLSRYSFGAVLLPWQGGMESGNAVADLLCGKVSPSGRLTDTVARDYTDYPSAAHFGSKDANEYQEDIYVGYRYFETFAPAQVLYPFGWGLSYTRFTWEAVSHSPYYHTVTVTNTGACSGQEALLLFVEKPMGALGTPARELVAFDKTPLLSPEESQVLTMRLSPEELAVYDDTGASGFPNAWVMQKGTYTFYLGENVRDARPVYTYTLPETTVVRRCREALAPDAPFPVYVCVEHDGVRCLSWGQAAPKTVNLKERILSQLPPALPYTGDVGIRLEDVKAGSASMGAFIAQLSPDELEALTRGGDIMDHPLGARGNAGVFGGVTPSLREKGIPPVVTTDGPSGIRLYDSCSLVPIGTLLACSMDTRLVEAVYRAVAGEMQSRGSNVLLAPGMNIHRNPLCGRNFEYYSEDPLLSGKLAAAAVRGIQALGGSACPKHFACNNQEVNRNRNNSILSQRALREIYLRGFRICIQESRPKNIMTSYNQINGVWAHYNFDLVRTILREEWGYRGNVMTDWWMQPGESPEFPGLRVNAYRVRAGVDLLMPGSPSYTLTVQEPDGTLLETYGQENGITLGEMQRCAEEILRCVLSCK